MRAPSTVYINLLFLILLFFVPAFSPSNEIWNNLDDGLDVARFSLNELSEDSSITIVRINPKDWNLKILSISETGASRGHSAREWCEKHNLTAAINGGMFDIDYKTHIGYMKSYEHINSSRRNKYLSAAAFDPFGDDSPLFKIFDLDEVSLDTLIANYNCVIQNLRLIKRNRENRWEPRIRKWAEVALAEDFAGNALFIFCSEQVTMYEFNERLLALPINIITAQHLEGGIQAQLYLKNGDYEVNLSGDFSTGISINNQEGLVSQLPNVIGIYPRDKND
ncbi:MAG: phosphodiester glycosidase family protein [candidate division Zixibacteria bacterium]